MIDQAVIDDLRALGDGFLADVVRQFGEELDTLVPELSTAVATGDHGAVLRIAHSIKGSAAQLGGRRLVSSCERLEAAAAGGSLDTAPAELREVESDYQELVRVLARELALPRPQTDLVLLVDDSTTTLAVASQQLRAGGYDVVTATCGDDALALAAERRPQLVVLDLEMPGIGGIEVLKQLRSDPAFAETPIILLTSHLAQEYIEAGLGAGASAYMVKPFSPRELHARVKELLERD